MIITNGTPVSAPLTAGYDDRNTFPTHFAKLGQGGFEVRDSLADIKTISEDRREDKLCLSLLEKQFFIYNQTLGDWEVYPIAGSADDWMSVLGVTITPTLVSFSKPVYSPKLSTAPGTVSIGNIDISGANSTLAVINTSTGARALMIGFTYNPSGSSSLKSYDLSEEEVHERQDDSSDVQPTNDYTFSFTIPDDVIRTGLQLMPAEAGAIEIFSNDVNGKLVTDSELFTFKPEDVGKVVDIPLRNHVVYHKGDVGTFTLKGAKARGKVIGGSFIPYFKSKEYTILSRPEVVTEVNIKEYHEESVIYIEPKSVITIPVNKYNVIVKYDVSTKVPLTQPFPDITLVKDGTRIWIENPSTVEMTIVPFSVSQHIAGRHQLVIPAKTGVTFIAYKHSNNWIKLAPYVADDIMSRIVMDGGGAASVMVEGLDGGSASSTFTRMIDAGGA